VTLRTSRLVLALLAYLALELFFALVCAFAAPVAAEKYSFAFSDLDAAAAVTRMRCEPQLLFVAYTLLAVPLAAGAFLAVKTLKIKEEYSDARAICISLCTLLIVPVPLLTLRHTLQEP